jgi:hypothetical protein
MDTMDAMTQQLQSNVASTGAHDPSPFLVEFFMVWGAGQKCMAYQEQDGSWRRAFDGQQLTGNVVIVE